jgi:hypothetical protein
MKFEDGLYQDKDLRERVEEVEGRRNTLLRLPDTIEFILNDKSGRKDNG